MIYLNGSSGQCTSLPIFLSSEEKPVSAAENSEIIKPSSSNIEEIGKNLESLQQLLAEKKGKFNLLNKELDLYDEALLVGREIFEVEEKIKFFNNELFKASVGVDGGEDVMKSNLNSLKRLLSEKNELLKSIEEKANDSNYIEKTKLYDEMNVVGRVIREIQKKIKFLKKEIFKTSIFDINEVKSNINSMKEDASKKKDFIEFKITEYENKVKEANSVLCNIDSKMIDFGYDKGRLLYINYLFKDESGFDNDELNECGFYELESLASEDQVEGKINEHNNQIQQINNALMQLSQAHKNEKEKLSQLDIGKKEFSDLVEERDALKKELQKLIGKEKIISKVQNKHPEMIVKLRPGELINERPSHSKPINESDRMKCQYYHNDNYRKGVDPLARSAYFDPEFKQAGLVKVLGKEGKEQLIDLREVLQEANNCNTYVPFAIEIENGKSIISSSAGGWLVLKSCTDSMHICRIDNFMYSSNNYRIGSMLIQFAIEKSIEAGFGGKVTLVSSGDSGGFYYKLGFVCESQGKQEKIEKAYRKNQRIAGDNMYLHEEAIIAWKKMIAENPIL